MGRRRSRRPVGPARARCDRLVDEWRTIIEADGRRWHTRVADFERDHWRDSVAQADGYAVLRFTYLRLTRERRSAIALLTRYGNPRRGAAA